MTIQSMTNKIFIDTDCISAFLWVKNESLLPILYPGQIVLPKPVYDELSRPNLNWMKKRIDVLLHNGQISIVDLTFGTEEFDLFYKMTLKPDQGYKVIGEGEASAIALAKVNQGILASNNFSDILPYIDKFSLEYTTTADILVDAYQRDFINMNQGNTIWKKMMNKKRKLGANSFSDYLENKSIPFK